MPTVALATLGCKVNQAETDALARRLSDAGWSVTDFDAPADAYVLNTCTVTHVADRKARQLLRQARRRSPHALLVATGCYATTDPAAIRGVPGVDLVVPNDRKGALPDLLAERLGATGGDAAAPGPLPGGRTRAFVKVQDGCDSFCSYCIVPAARGVPRSVPLAEVLAEVEELLKAGVREVVLTGVNLGRYESSGTDLAGLVAAAAACGVPRLRLSSIEPLDLTDGLLETLASTRAVAPHLHVPLQSGSDRVLERMRRRYQVAEYARRLDSAREALSGLAVTTDVIAGFPGEFDKDAEETRKVCEDLGFSRLHVFRFSSRAATPAESLPEQVPPDIRSRRAAELRGLDRALRERFARSRVGGIAELLVERVSAAVGVAGASSVGTSGDYLKIRIVGEELRVGDLVSVELAGVNADGSLVGVLRGGCVGIQ